jgi:SOS response regulatory protein OraA/RecX
MTQQGSGNNLKDKAGQFGLTKMLTNLTARGYDVSAISAAVTSGDYRNASTLLQEFRTAHPDAFPAHVAGAFKGQMNGQAMGERMTQMLTNLTARGYDVSAISAAVTSGDYKTAFSLLQEFRTAHPDAFPAHVAGAFKGQMTGQAAGERMTQMLTNLTAKGYDVSAISAAVTSGDYKTAFSLLQEFRTAHPDAFPAHVAGAGTGHPGWHRRAQTNQ